MVLNLVTSTPQWIKKKNVVLDHCLVKPVLQRSDVVIYILKKVLLIGTQFSNLYTAVDTPAGEAA